jgi:hypothetical protein
VIGATITGAVAKAIALVRPASKTEGGDAEKQTGSTKQKPGPERIIDFCIGVFVVCLFVFVFRGMWGYLALTGACVAVVAGGITGYMMWQARAEKGIVGNASTGNAPPPAGSGPPPQQQQTAQPTQAKTN